MPNILTSSYVTFTSRESLIKKIFFVKIFLYFLLKAPINLLDGWINFVLYHHHHIFCNNNSMKAIPTLPYKKDMCFVADPY